MKRYLFLFFFISSFYSQSFSQVKSYCQEGKESGFFRLMTDKFLQYIFQTGVEDLPYNIKQVLDLMKDTCIIATDQRLSIDSEFKDAVNYYPSKKLIVLYRPVWKDFQKKYELNDWNIEYYYQLFRIIHHEIVPYFIKKGDPNFEASAILYNYLTPFISPEEYVEKRIYVQKRPSPSFYPYLGENCAITVAVNKYKERPMTPEEIDNDTFSGYRSYTMEIQLGLQNPSASNECPRLFDLEAASLQQKSKRKYLYNFLIFCETEPLKLDLNLLYSLPKHLKSFNGEFTKYRPYKCKTNEALEPEIDRNLGAFIKMEVDFLPEKEIRLIFNFHRDSWDKKVFSFSNIYSPVKTVKEPSKYSGLFNKRLQKTTEYISKIKSYPIQRWLYLNKLKSSEENCSEAKKWIEKYVHKACQDWITYNFSNITDISTYLEESIYDDIIFAGIEDKNNLYCNRDSYKIFEIHTPADHGCIVVGEELIYKKSYR